jgi:hypothetical protein
LLSVSGALGGARVGFVRGGERRGDVADGGEARVSFGLVF